MDFNFARHESDLTWLGIQIAGLSKMLYNRLNFLLKENIRKQFKLERISFLKAQCKLFVGKIRHSNRSNEIYASQLLSRYGNVATLSKTCRQQKNQQHVKKVEKEKESHENHGNGARNTFFLFYHFSAGSVTCGFNSIVI